MNLIITCKQLRKLIDERLHMQLKQSEHTCILNCQPLTELTDKVNATLSLTPMMLLSGCVDSGHPPDIFLNSNGLRRARQLRADVFWNRWQSKYLYLLQHRQKWLTAQRNLWVGNLALPVDKIA